MTSIDEAPVSALWLRRTTDGRCLVLGILNNCPLPEGVNDAVVQTQLMLEEYRDATKEGVGRSYMDIISNGWKGVGGEQEPPPMPRRKPYSPPGQSHECNST